MFNFKLLSVAIFLKIVSRKCHPPDFGSTLFDRQFPGYFSSNPQLSSETYESKVTAFRLPSNVIPKSYRLKLVPNLSDEFSFSGEVVIRVYVEENINVILLHSHELYISSVKITLGTQIFQSSYALLPLTQMLNITTKRYLPYGNNFDITIEFNGKLNDRMMGFYRSKYRINNQIRWLAATHFEPTYARMAFPCFDEPRFRAEFTVSIARYKYQKVMSNMPLKDTSDPIKSLDNRVVDKFKTTPPMPTYIVVFVVSEFPFIQKYREGLQFWARENVIKDGEYALRQTETMLQGFENMTNIRYDLPKIDLAAIPDIEPSAMENWGLMTFRESYILYDKDLQSAVNKERVMTSLAHVLAHQWFGNCVTMAWWDFLWLKEGFSTYFEYFETAKRKPNWRMDEKFVVRATHYALSIDGIHIHHSMNGKVNTPSEIRGLFDGISYHKAAAVIHMIRNFLTDEPFQRAIKMYLADRISDGRITIPDDLYNTLELVRIIYERPMPKGLNLFVMMEQFANQVGYPLITVTRHINGDFFDIHIKQAPYRSPRSEIMIPDQIWTIPIACAKKSEYHMNKTVPTIWSYNKEKVLLENVVLEKEWYICNVQQTGYYRVNYDRENWILLRDQLKIAPEEIHPINRAQIIDDSYTLALDEKLSFSTALSLLSYLKYERDPIPWYTGIEKLHHLYTQFEATSVATDLKRVAVELITNFYNFVGFDPKITDDQPIKEFRKTLTMVSCELRITHCISKAKMWYYETQSLNDIPIDIKETVLCTIMRINSTVATWNRLWEYYRATYSAAKKETILSATGCTTNEELHEKYLFKLIDDHDDDIRLQDEVHVFRSVLRFHSGVTSTLKFIKNILPQIKKYRKGHEIILSLLSRMKLVVKSKEHECLLNDSVIEAKKLDQGEYGDIMTVLKLLQNSVQVNMQQNDQRVSELSSAVSYYDRSNRKSRWSHFKSSSSSILISMTNVILLSMSHMLVQFGPELL